MDKIEHFTCYVAQPIIFNFFKKKLLPPNSWKISSPMQIHRLAVMHQEKKKEPSSFVPAHLLNDLLPCHCNIAQCTTALFVKQNKIKNPSGKTENLPWTKARLNRKKMSRWN
jgi:hypothetical protein